MKKGFQFLRYEPHPFYEFYGSAQGSISLIEYKRICE